MIPETNPNQTREQWTAPMYQIGTRVLYAKDPTFSEAALGYIVSLKSNGIADIMVTFYFPGHGMSIQPREDCYNAADPNVKKRPAEFWDGGNGVYRIAPIESELITLREKVAALESAQSAIEPERRGPGRPPKALQSQV